MSHCRFLTQRRRESFRSYREKFQKDPDFDRIYFHEYFHGETGWTGLVENSSNSMMSSVLSLILIISVL